MLLKIIFILIGKKYKIYDSAAAPFFRTPPSSPSVTGALCGDGREGGEEKFPTIIINFVIITMTEYL